MSQEVDRGITALSALTETVYFADLSALKNGRQASLDPLEWPVTFLMASFDEVGLKESIQDRCQHVALGAKNFRPAKGLGSVRWDGCYIVTLSPNSQFKMKDTAKGSSQSVVQGIPVWNWQLRVEEDLWPFYMTQPSDRVVLVATSLELLTSVVGHIRTGNGQIANSSFESALGWRYVDRTKPIWAIRRYGHNAKDRDAAGLNIGGDIKLGDDALALMLSYDSSKGAVLLGYISISGGEGPLALFAGGAKASIRKTGNKTWEALMPALNKQTDIREFQTILYLLGFGAYT